MNSQEPDIIKIAALPINNKGELLIVKPVDKESWISLGGMLEENETEIECLKREISEELGVETLSDPEFFCETPVEIAAGTTDVKVVVKFYLVDINEEKIKPDGQEIGEFKWLSKKEFEEDIKRDRKYKIGSGLELYAIPKLIQENLLT